VCERDIDLLFAKQNTPSAFSGDRNFLGFAHLLLLEEFVSSPAFVQWFVDKISGCKIESVISAARSVKHTNGESDLEIFLRLSDGEKMLLLIENKVSAGFQKDQARRYQLRAENYVATGRAKKCLTFLAAPADYLDHTNVSRFDAAISYEEIDEAMDSFADPARKKYKSFLLRKAIEKSTHGYNMVEDRAVTAFWRDYWTLAMENVPTLNMKKPGGKPGASSFIYFDPVSLPKGIRIVHKVSRGYVDLQISGAASVFPEFVRRLRPHLGENMELAITNKSVSIRIYAPVLNIWAELTTQVEDALLGLSAAERLLEWGLAHMEMLSDEVK